MTSTACVVVPIFNEAKVLASVLETLLDSFEHVVCIDDGSTDGSAAIADASGAVVLRHAVNLGQGAALQTGIDYVLRFTSFQHIVTFDADGQHDVTDALAMLAHARAAGVDVVLGSRTIGSTIDQPVARRLLLSAGLRFSRWTTGLALTDTHNGLRVLSRTALQTLKLRQPGMAYATELETHIARRELSWVEHPVSIRYSEYSRSKGQGNLNAFNILFDLFAARLGSPT